MKIGKTFLATIAACLASWLVMCAGFLVIIPMFSNKSVLPFFWMCLPVPFAFSLVIGWPSRVLLQRRHILSLKAFVVTGVVAGALTALAYSLLAARDNSLRVYLVFLFISVLHLSMTSTAGYVVFWRLAMKGSPNKFLHGTSHTRRP